MLSTAIDVILTTLRYLAPATVLTLFWGQQSFLFRFLKYIDCAVRSLLFSSEEQKQEILEWLADAGPVRVDSLDVVWRHGWILCGILDSALPGACAGHPPTRLSLKHAQAIADNYLGVEPAFTRQELDLNDSISRYQEWRLINFLERIRIALLKLRPSSKINSQTNQKSTPDDTHFTLNYVARGSGLVAAQIDNKVYFKIYPTAQQSLDPGDINIIIHGPKDIYGTTVLPPVLGKAQLIRQNLLGLQSKSTHTENVLPITQGTTYLRSYGKSNMSKTYYIPKTKYDIDIETEIMQDHAKVGYVATLEGTYEISITSKGQNVVGSPFKVTASKDIVGILERDSFCLEDGEEIDIVDIKTDKKVVLRIVDFVTEKMLLKENGSLEKITEEDAKYLLENDNIKSKHVEYPNKTQEKNVAPIIEHTKESNKFYKIAQKVLTLNRVCNFISNANCKNISKKNIVELNNKQHIPDVVNSTFCDDKEKNKSYALSEKRDRIIIPENISVSILTEMPKPISEIKIKTMNTPNIKEGGFLDDNYNTITSDPFEDDNMSVDTVQSFNNPFLCDMTDQTYAIAKQFGSFIPNEYESNNSQNEETENANVKSFDETKYEIMSRTKNPFQEYVDIERPKTPVYKIITGKVTGRDDSVYIDPNIEESFNKNLLNDFTNPFVDQDNSHIYQDKPDFIIGAPVSLPPVINVPSSNPSSTTLTKSISVKKSNRNIDIKFLESDKLKNERKISNSSNNSNLYSSFDSNLTEDVNITPNSSPVPSSTGHTNSSREMSPRNNTWDSAYVSIDDNHCSSESNVSSELSSSDMLNKRKSQFSSAFSKMGPAEREIWQHDNNLKISKTFEDDIKIQKYDAKRHECKPIYEENEKAITVKDVSDMKDKINEMRMDPVTEAFAELDDIYDEIMTRSEVSSVTTTKDNQSQNLEIDYTVEIYNTHVDSASEFKADVKRQTKILEGKISEIQARVTESISASRYLHVKENYEENNNENKAGVQFGDQTYTNIVSEKKKYWDEKIRQIEAKSEEIKALQCKRRITLKHMRRNDSLSKRRGKKIVQNFLGTNQDECDKLSKPYARSDTFDSLNDIEVIDSQIINKNDQDSTNENEALTCFGKMTLKNKEHSLIDTFKHIKVSNDINMNTDSDEQNSNSNLHLKQELSEKVFQAFETSPKRFFGTSRQHILNKIDTFLGLPDSENDKKKIVEDVSHESGLVSSRISLFHSISQTEELPWARRKCKSMYNIHQDSDKCIYSDTKSTLANRSMIKYSIDLEKEDCLEPSKDSFQDKFQSPLKEKQVKITHDIQNKSFDESLYMSKPSTYVKNTIKDLNKQNQLQNKEKTSKLKSISKSEMDIFSKVGSATVDEDLEKHKSYEELPKINVKNFISLYEDVSKSSKTSPTRTISRSNSMRSPNNMHISSSIPGTPKKYSTSVNEITMHLTLPSKTNKDEAVSSDRRRRILSKDKSFEIFSNDSASSSLDFEVISNQDQETNRLSLSDIEIEIIEKEPEINTEPVIEPEAHIEYKNRFTKAKKYFQSLEELREEKKAMKLTKHSLFTSSQSTESLEEKKPRRKSNIKKSRSMPSSEIAKIWNQMQEEKEAESKKLVKISEKFNVDDLFEDVMEGRLSRQGSLRGIPHKKAVLETFKSMENIADSNLNSYEMAVSQLNEFAHENKIKNAQTYLSEYPYLPTTDPSKYHSRLDPNASGLITLKELKKKPRRNSVPDLRLNPTFTADL